jgi:hypothetical protein
MRARPIVQLAASAIVLFVLLGAVREPAQASTYSPMSCRLLETETAPADNPTLTALGLAIVTASGDIGPSISLPPRAADRCDPSAGFDWVVRMTVVVIALSGSIGALGSYLTRATPPRSRIA